MLVEIITTFLYWGATLLIGIITGLVIYIRWNYGTLEKVKGLKGIAKPAFLGGSEPFQYKKIVFKNDMELVKKFGSVYGFYEGREPQIYISDAELIRLIYVKDFEYFSNKRNIETGHEYVNDMMDMLPYEKWKVVRNYLSPSLTSGKIKAMSYQMHDCITDWAERVKSQAAQGNSGVYEFNPKPAYMTLTCDVIARCVFGTKVNAFDDPDNQFMKNLKMFALDGVEMGPMMSLITTVPIFFKFFPFFPAETIDYFGDLLKSILKTRRESKQKVNDFVDLINDMLDLCNTPEYKKNNINEATVMSQAMIFLIAGFDTTANTLSVLSLKLATHPEIQDKLLKEIDDYYKRHDGKLEHETLTELTYLHACMNETLRMHAPLIRIERVCQKTWKHEASGLEIPKDMVVQVPVYAVHYNEEYFPEPHTFKPERFLPENKDKLNPYSFLSFGQGPHNCIGMRFAKEEIQMTLATILKDYYFKPTANSKLTPVPGRTFLQSYEPFTLNMCKRSK